MALPQLHLIISIHQMAQLGNGQRAVRQVVQIILFPRWLVAERRCLHGNTGTAMLVLVTVQTCDGPDSESSPGA